ncbi:MAG: hypothetical protein ACRCZ2_00415 [Fusobacteriaceae bacterium]
MSIYNFTVHTLTNEQKQDGAVEVNEDIRSHILKILNMENMPSSQILYKRALELADIAKKNNIKKILIGSGVPAFNYFLVKKLKDIGVEGIYSFSKRVCVESHCTNGEVKKEYVFKHLGFYSVNEY